MASDTDKSFFKKIEDHIIKWMIGIGLTSITALVTFYFTTTATLEAHEKTGQDHTERLTSIEKIIVKIASNPELTSVQIQDIKTTLEDIRQRQIKYEENQTKANERMDNLYDKVIKLFERSH